MTEISRSSNAILDVPFNPLVTPAFAIYRGMKLPSSKLLGSARRRLRNSSEARYALRGDWPEGHIFHWPSVAGSLVDNEAGRKMTILFAVARMTTCCHPAKVQAPVHMCVDSRLFACGMVPHRVNVVTAPQAGAQRLPAR